MNTYNSVTLYVALESGQLNWLCSNPILWLRALLAESLKEEAEAEAMTPHGLTEDERNHWTIDGYHDWKMTDPWGCTVTYHYDPDKGSSTATIAREGCSRVVVSGEWEDMIWQLNTMRHM